MTLLVLNMTVFDLNMTVLTATMTVFASNITWFIANMTPIALNMTVFCRKYVCIFSKKKLLNVTAGSSKSVGLLQQGRRLLLFLFLLHWLLVAGQDRLGLLITRQVLGERGAGADRLGLDGLQGQILKLKGHFNKKRIHYVYSQCHFEVSNRLNYTVWPWPFPG